jgi:hypothetical protein
MRRQPLPPRPPNPPPNWVRIAQNIHDEEYIHRPFRENMRLNGFREVSREEFWRNKKLRR